MGLTMSERRAAGEDDRSPASPASRAGPGGSAMTVPTGTTLPGNHRSHCTISPAVYVVRSAGSATRNNRRSCATLAHNTDEECSDPIRSAITVAGMSGNSVSKTGIAGSNASTNNPPAGRSYIGGSCAANAARTVLRAFVGTATGATTGGWTLGGPQARSANRVNAEGGFQRTTQHLE